MSTGGCGHAGRRRAQHALLATVSVVSLGGVIGSLLRYQAGLIWPTPVSAFPTTILLVNLRLFEQRARLFAVANVAGSVLAGLVAVTAGFVITAAVTGT